MKITTGWEPYVHHTRTGYIIAFDNGVVVEWGHDAPVCEQKSARQSVWPWVEDSEYQTFLRETLGVPDDVQEIDDAGVFGPVREYVWWVIS